MQDKEIRRWQNEQALRRYEMIAPLLDPDMDIAKKSQLRDEIAEKEHLSKRTVYRYEAAYRAGAFEGLLPMNRAKRRSQKLPDNWEEIVGQAILLKREVPRRSVRQIILILETEGWAAPGAIRPSTLQRYLYNAGLGVKQMKRYTEKTATSSRRFCRPHRLELLQGDIKYGPIIRTTDGKKIKTYLSSLIDDHSRYVVQAEFYGSQRKEIVEDTFHKAVLKVGVWDCAYLDNGKQYIASTLMESCARLGIRILHAKPYACESKGKIERYHQTVDRFIAEIRAAHVHDIEELNRRWKIFLEMDYQKKPHSGIAEYYKSQGIEVPGEGISPEMEWLRDERRQKFVDVKTVSEAFTHHEMRTINGDGCFSIDGTLYEASTALAGMEAEVSFDPLDMDTVTVSHGGMTPINARKVRIGAYASKTPDRPEGMTGSDPETSRFLDAIEKRYKEAHAMQADALSFGDYGKEGDSDV